MNPCFRSLFFCAVVIIAPVAFSAEPVPAAVPGDISAQQMADGLKSGLGSIVDAALAQFAKPGAVMVSPPPALAKLEKLNQGGASDAFSTSLSQAVAAISPQAAELMRETFKIVKIDDAKTVLSGGPDAGTQYLRKAMTPVLREKLLPLVKQAMSSAGVAAKAKEMLAAAGPLAAMGGGKGIADLDGYVCDQVITRGFQLMAKEEAVVRANPALLTSGLAQKAFALLKK